MRLECIGHCWSRYTSTLCKKDLNELVATRANIRVNLRAKLPSEVLYGPIADLLSSFHYLGASGYVCECQLGLIHKSLT